MYLSAEPPERKPRAQLTEKAPNPPSFCRKKVPSFVLGRRWSPAPAGNFSPHAGAATHGNGISKLATHPPQHADAPSLQLAAVVLSPFPSHRRAPAGKFSPHADAFNPRKWHFRTRHPSATPRGCALPAARRGSPLSLSLSPRGHGRAAAFSRSAPRRGAARRAALRPPALRRAAHAPAASPRAAAPA